MSVLKDLHDRLDDAVFEAYGWPKDLTDEQIVERLVALNAERAAEESKGLVRWLRPEFQNPAASEPVQGALEGDDEAEEHKAPEAAAVTWPASLPERIAVVREAVSSRGTVTLSQVAKAVGAKRPAQVAEVLEGLEPDSKMSPVEGALAGWHRLAVLQGHDGTLSLSVLEPDTQVRSIEVGGFYVRGLFRIAESFEREEEALRVWQTFHAW